MAEGAGARVAGIDLPRAEARGGTSSRLTAGAAGSAPMSTNLIRVHVMERILAEGTGFGTHPIQGRARVLGDLLPDAADIHSSDLSLIHISEPTRPY